MWNSNSFISWLLVRSGLDRSSIHPPAGGRAPVGTPGWWLRDVNCTKQASNSRANRLPSCLEMYRCGFLLLRKGPNPD